MGMKSAVIYGLSQPDSLISQQIQPSCPSGNCTWDTFMSLAVCSACKNLTNQIKEGEKELVDPSKYDRARRLPNGLTTLSTIPMSAYGSGNENKSVSFTSHDTLIWSMTMINTTIKDPKTLAADYFAIECGLWYCVNSYKSVVKDGRLTELVEPARSTREPDSWRPFLPDLSWDVADPSYAFSKSINLFDNSTVSQPFKGLSRFDSYSYVRRTDLQLGEGFNLSQSAIYSVSKLMNNTFVDLEYSDEGSYNAQVRYYFGWEFPDQFSPGINLSRSYHPTAMQSLYHSPNLEKTFASLAKSMTNSIRQNSDNNTVVYGNEGKLIVVFRIQGRFLILPVILIFGGAVFLVTTLYYTHKLDIPFWGTNALPIVAFGGRMGSIFDDNDMIKTSTMEQQAKRLLVQQHFLLQSTSQTENSVMAPPSRTSTSRTEDPVMPSPSRISTMHNPPADVVSVISSSRISATHNPSADVVSIISSSRTSRAVRSLSLDALSIVSNHGA